MKNSIRAISKTAHWLLGAFFVLAINLGALSLIPAQAATFTVTNASDSGPGSLRQAMADAAAGDVITFDGDYAITLADTLTIDKDLTIDGGTHAVTISGNDAVRVFLVLAGIQVSFNHLTISHGKTITPDPDYDPYPVGGGIKIEAGAVVTLTDSVVDNNVATHYFADWSAYLGFGGGIFNLGTLTVIGTTFSNNVASAAIGYVDGYGGAICNLGSLTVSDSTFTGNAAASGGAIYGSFGTTMAVESSLFTGNSAPCGGAAITGSGTTTVAGCTITNNIAPGNWCESGAAGISNQFGTMTVSRSTISGNINEGYSGGGLSSYGINPDLAHLTVVDCTIENNTAYAHGGGIHNWWDSTLIVSNSTVSNNTAGWYGGGILSGPLANTQLTLTNTTLSGNSAQNGGGLYNGYPGNSDSVLTMTSTTVADNTATDSGGGLFNHNSAAVTLSNSILWGNSAPAGPQVYNDTANRPTISYSDIHGSGGSGAGWDTSLGTDGGGNLDQAPLLGPLADNGGPTLTRALPDGSPAIDVADAAACPAKDQRGVPRPLGAGCDMGAFENAAGNILFHPVSYDANGATSGTAPADQTKIYNVDLVLAANSGGLARTAYIFDGWNTATDGLGTDYAEGATYTANAAMTLYAKWTPELDFGDAPDPTYQTLLASNGARHIIVPGYHLGAGIDADVDGQPTADALGDDSDGNDDEDGVVFGPLVPCQQVAVTITASGNGLIDAWIDFNGDGDWSDAGEQIFTSQAVTTGPNVLNFDTPCDAVLGQTFARVRFSSTGGLLSTGLAADGEVEDYVIEILVDADGDGEPDITDGCPADPLKTAPGVCGCGVSDSDTDSDGTPNCIDGCPYDPAKTSPGLNGCGVSDTVDSDGDGVTDSLDGCPNDPAKVNPGVCGCGVSDVDTDGDGTPDCNDNCPNDPAKTAPDVCGCGTPDSDADNDGIPDCIDDTPDEVWNDYNDDDAPFCEFIPVAVLPIDGAAEISLTPDLVIEDDIDPTACGDIYQTRWQISRQPDFQELTYNRDTLFDDPFSHQIAPGILEPETTYYWRARVWCGQGCKSRYSETVSFTTAPDPNDGGQTGGQVTHSLGVYAVVGNQYVSIETTGNITFLQALDNNDQEILAGMPDNMPWGLINFRIEITNPGDTVQVTIYFEEQAPDGAAFYKYDPIDGWIDYSAHAVFAADGKSVTIEVQDGGFGDLDGSANGVIVDPCGIGKDSSGGGSGGCFVEAVKDTQ